MSDSPSQSNTIFEILPHNGIYGGIKSANKIITLLRRSGYTAYVAVPDGKPAAWLVDPAPCLSWEEAQQRAKPHDVLIFNWMPDVERWKSPGVVVVHARDQFQDFKSSTVAHYWAVSPLAEEYLRTQGVTGEIVIVSNWIDQSIFKPVQKISRSVAYMTRRGFEFIGKIIQRRADIIWLSIENESESRVAALLGQAELFLYPTKGPERITETDKLNTERDTWLNKRLTQVTLNSTMPTIRRLGASFAKFISSDKNTSTETFGNPGLEAMACGAVPLSFDFDAPYFLPDNHLTITPGTIESGIDFMLSNPHVVQSMKAAGLKTAADWNEQRVRHQLYDALHRCAENHARSHE